MNLKGKLYVFIVWLGAITLLVDLFRADGLQWHYIYMEGLSTFDSVRFTIALWAYYFMLVYSPILPFSVEKDLKKGIYESAIIFPNFMLKEQYRHIFYWNTKT